MRFTFSAANAGNCLPAGEGYQGLRVDYVTVSVLECFNTGNSNGERAEGNYAESDISGGSGNRTYVNFV